MTVWYLELREKRMKHLVLEYYTEMEICEEKERA